MINLEFLNIFNRNKITLHKDIMEDYNIRNRREKES